MITSDEIRQRAKKMWSNGRVLRAWLNGTPEFPWPIAFRKPSAEDWLHCFAELRPAIARLEASAKAATGAGYTLTLKEIAHQKLGRLRVPEAIVFDSAEDVAAAAGEAATLRRFRALATDLRAREPRLAAWMARQPFALLEREDALPRLLAVAEHLQEHPRPGRFARELGIAGVDSKFAEIHRALLAEWLDCLLPAAHVDSAVRGLADYGFERRYGLRHEEPQLRFRWLDGARSLAGNLSDLTVPLPQFVDYAPACARVFVTENKISFLTLPDCRDSLVIFGEGYAIDRLATVPWLGNQPLLYWGDIDTHGFAILSRLRGYWPHTRALLMDRQTLLSHRDLWTDEPHGRRCLHDLTALEPDEAALFNDLRGDVLGEHVRFEQERVEFSLVREVVRQEEVDGALPGED
jgi:hypothetical protein